MIKKLQASAIRFSYARFTVTRLAGPWTVHAGLDLPTAISLNDLELSIESMNDHETTVLG